MEGREELDGFAFEIEKEDSQPKQMNLSVYHVDGEMEFKILMKNHPKEGLSLAISCEKSPPGAGSYLFCIEIYVYVSITYI